MQNETRITTWMGPSSERQELDSLYQISENDSEPFYKRCCDTKTAIIGLISTLGFVTTASFSIRQIIIKGEVWKLYLSTLFNGPCTAMMFHTFFPEKQAKIFRGIYLSSSFAVQFFPAQVQNNWIPKEVRKYTVDVFIENTGALVAADLYHIFFTRSRSDSPFPSEPPQSGSKLIPMLWFNTRNPHTFKVLAIGSLINAIVVEAAFWGLIDGRYSDELSRIGFWGHLTHAYAFSELGGVLARILDDKREELQKKFREELDLSEASPPWSLYVHNIYRNLIPLFPFASCLLFQFLEIPSGSNQWLTLGQKLRNLAIMVPYGLTIGTIKIIGRRGYEDPDSKEHKIHNAVVEVLDENPINEIEESRSLLHSISNHLPSGKKIWNAIKKFALSIFITIAVNAWFAYVLYENRNSKNSWDLAIPIIAFLISYNLAFLGGTLLHEKHVPDVNKNSLLDRVTNELHFGISQVALFAMFYVFLREHSMMNSRHLISDSPESYKLAVSGYAVLGLAWGLHEASCTQKTPLLTPGITLVEMGLITSELLIPPK